MPTTPIGSIAQPLADIKAIMLNLPEFQTWAGASFANRVHLNENRKQYDEDLWYSEGNQMPFLLLWMETLAIQDLSICSAEWTIRMLFQAEATSRNDHNESFLAFASPVGDIMDKFLASINGKVQNIGASMIGQPTRIGITESHLLNDFWVGTYELASSTGGRG